MKVEIRRNLIYYIDLRYGRLILKYEYENININTINLNCVESTVIDSDSSVRCVRCPCLASPCMTVTQLDSLGWVYHKAFSREIIFRNCIQQTHSSPIASYRQTVYKVILVFNSSRQMIDRTANIE